jgi:ABC-type transport system involved in multi-copper enzyme maturation permease subunit
MRDALAYEWLRIRTIRSTYWLTGLALGFSVLVAVAVSWAMRVSIGGPDSPSQQDIGEIGAWLGTQFARAGAPHFVGYLLAMIGILSWGHEYRHGMIRATLTSLNSRTSVWLAKYVVVVAWVAVTVTVGFLLSVSIGAAFLSGTGIGVFGAETWGALGRAVLSAVLLACLAMAFTGVVRNQTAALVLLFLWPLAIENVITLVFYLVPGLDDQADLTRFLPFAAAGRINNDSVFSQGDTLFGNPMSWAGGLLIFGAFTAALMAAGIALFRNRDA